jgi:hypothetical protein
MQDPNDLSEKIDKVVIADVNTAAEGEELSEAEQKSVSGGGSYGPDSSGS